MTLEEMAAAIRAGDDPLAVLRIACAAARCEALEEAEAEAREELVRANKLLGIRRRAYTEGEQSAAEQIARRIRARIPSIARSLIPAAPEVPSAGEGK